MAFPRTILVLARNWRRVIPLMRDQRVPGGLKAATALVALLIISPLDVFGDIPVIGVLDDAVLLTLVCSLFVLLATRLIERNVTPRNGSGALTFVDAHVNGLGAGAVRE